MEGRGQSTLAAQQLNTRSPKFKPPGHCCLEHLIPDTESFAQKALFFSQKESYSGCKALDGAAPTPTGKEAESCGAFTSTQPDWG